MKRLFCVLAVLGLSGVALAQDLELSFSAGSQPFSVNLALSNLIVLSDPQIALEAAVSNRRAMLGVSGALEFAPVGRATAYTRFFVAYLGGLRFEAGARGALGPVALELGTAVWSADSSTFEPNAAFAWNPEPISISGFYVSAQGTYRLNRSLLAVGHLRYGSDQSRVSAGLENRAGEWTVGGSLLFAWQRNGLTYGLEAMARWSPENLPFSLEAQGFVGVNQVVGFGFGGAGVLLRYDLQDLGSFSLYGIYEVWRLDVLPLRLGAGLELNLGPGTAFVRGFGGADLDWAFGWGFTLGYRLSLESILNP